MFDAFLSFSFNSLCVHACFRPCFSSLCTRGYYKSMIMYQFSFNFVPASILHWIEEFVSCGPKNYSFRVNTGEIVCKVRGFSLNYKSSLILNFESMKEALVAWKRNEKKELVTVKTELVRDKYKPKVFNRVISKHYGVVYDKRKILPDFTSIPFGFRY